MSWEKAKTTRWKTKSVARSAQHLKYVGCATFGKSDVRDVGLGWTLKNERCEKLKQG